MPVYKKTIELTINAIQFDGTNIKDVFQFICDYRANANDVKFENLAKRPEEIPLDIDSLPVFQERYNAWREKYKNEYEGWQSSYGNYELSDFFTEEALKELDDINKYRPDWHAGELYQIYLATGDGYCRLVGISKNDWFVYDDRLGKVCHFSNDGFTNHIECNGWQEDK